jgi:hypothetical protein
MALGWLLVAALLTLASPHVRVSAPDLSALLQDGVRRSNTLAARVARLETSDLVVHIDYDRGPIQAIGGYVTFVTASGGWRYVRIRIHWELSKHAQLAMLAHELQHAVEIADAPEVSDEASLAVLYSRIGSERWGGGCRSFETRAAMEAEDQAVRELRLAPPTRVETAHDARTPRHPSVRGTFAARDVQ